LKAKEQEEREARLTKLRPSIRNLLKGNPNVQPYTTFLTADKLFAQHPIWQQAKIESERRLIFEEHITEVKQREMVCPFSIQIYQLHRGLFLPRVAL
jgi:pre-mRNA-processing factor 40